jgi:hypothetical protein
MTLLLRHLDVRELTAAAGGDPWQQNNTIQSGSPGEISELATAFYEAGVCMGDTSDEFNAAKARFESAWDRDDGGAHPINDSAEVQRGTASLHFDKEKVARIAVDLETISASLAEAQQASAGTITTLEAGLQQIDDAIDAAILQNGLVIDENNLAPLKNMAIQEVREALNAIDTALDTYTGELTRAMTSMQAEGYVPDALDGADGDGVTTTETARGEAADYNFQQRAADQALMDSGGPMTPEKAAAAARLRDYATIRDPNADPAAARLAGERLDDFQTAQQPPGNLRPDPVLGANPQHRAMARQEWQKQLEQGSPWMPPMTPDEATAWMDQQEAHARDAATDSAIKGLESQGLSHDAATGVVDAMSRGVSLADLAAAANPLSEIKQLDGALSDGRHSLPWERYSTADLKALAGVGKTFLVVGSVLETAAAINDWNNGAAPGKTFGGLIGSLGGGAAAGAGGGFLGGLVLGPSGAFVGAVVGGLAGSAGGASIGSGVGGTFDN